MNAKPDKAAALAELKKENETLKRSLSHFRALLEHSRDFILISDADAKPVVWNSAYAEIMKVSLDIDMVPGLQPHKLLDDPQKIAWWDDMHRRVLSGEAFSREYTHELGDGTVIHLEVSYAPIREGDAIVGFLEITRDITRHLRAKEALKASEERLRSFFEHAPIGVVILAPGNQILSTNPFFCRIMGATPDELETLSLNEIVEPGDLARLRAEFADSGEAVRQFELPLRRQDGTRVSTRVVASQVRDKKGEVRFAVVMVEDITDRLALEEKLRHAHKMEAVGTLAAGIAHDFNNTLGIILGNAELAMDEIPDWSQARDCLRDVRDAALRAREIVRQILTFGRKVESDVRPVSMTTAVADALRVVRSTIPAEVRVVEKLDVQEDVVDADPAQIIQVVQNLCANAVEAMGEGGGILTVGLERVELNAVSAESYPDLSAGAYVALTIDDTGQGIAPEIRDRIFDPYFSTHRRGPGTGMGLAVVHGIITAAGGGINVDSLPDKGTRFSILLPVSKRLAPREEPPASLQARGGESILLIDDEPFLAKMGKRMLEPLGYHVDARTDPMEALELFRRAPEKIDLVITDMSMPELRGDHLAVEMMGIRPDIPIILCTGHSEVMDEEKALAMGIRAYLLKPYERDALAAVVKRVLETNKVEK